MLPVVFKILTPKVIKGIMSYVFDKNALDEQMDMVLYRLEKLEKDSKNKMMDKAEKITANLEKTAANILNPNGRQQ